MTERIPDLMFPIVGYRVWRYSLGDVMSDSSLTTWNKEELKYEHLGKQACEISQCNQGNWGSVADLGCGIYAFKNIGSLLVELGLYFTSTRSDEIMILGEAYLYGTVVEHEHGWRASKARIKCFYDFCAGKKAANRIDVPLGPVPKEVTDYVESRKETESMGSGGYAFYRDPAVGAFNISWKILAGGISPSAFGAAPTGY